MCEMALTYFVKAFGWTQLWGKNKCNYQGNKKDTELN